MKYENVEVNSKRWFDLKQLLNEEFRDIKGYEGLYQISNYGRVKSLKYFDKLRKHNRTKILKQCLSQNGYYVINLNNKSERVHRLVAINFKENTNNYYCVNHIDGNKKNNKVSNLEWCTSSHNNKEAYRLGIKVGVLKGKYGKDNPQVKNIIGKFKDNQLIEKFYGTGEIKRKYNYSPSLVLDCCKGKYKSAYGYNWGFINE